MTYDNTNKGIISKNDRKTEENHPDIAGSINVDGKEYWLNGWLRRRGSDGSPFYSLAVKPKLERAAEIRKEANGAPANFADELSDDIPFEHSWR